MNGVCKAESHAAAMTLHLQNKGTQQRQ